MQALNLLDRLEESERVMHAHMMQAAKAAEECLVELRNLNPVPSLAQTQPSGEATSKDGGAGPLDLFDEIDGETESQRRAWASADNYDMRDGK